MIEADQVDDEDPSADYEAYFATDGHVDQYRVGRVSAVPGAPEPVRLPRAAAEPEGDPQGER